MRRTPGRVSMAAMTLRAQCVAGLAGTPGNASLQYHMDLAFIDTLVVDGWANRGWRPAQGANSCHDGRMP